MKKIKGFLVVFGILAFFLILLITESNRDTPARRQIRKDYIDPFVEAQLYGVITQVRRTDLDLTNVLSGRRSQRFTYFDFDQQQNKNFETGLDEPLLLGDTIRKNKGENHFTLSGHGRTYESYRIDSKRP